MATVVAAGIAVGIGVWQYRRTSRDEFIKPLREAQLAEYRRATAAVSSLATLSRETKEWQAAKATFLELYYGPLTMFEDFDHSSEEENIKPTVEVAMIAVKHCLDNGNWADLKNLSLGLGHICRASLGTTWDYTLPPLAEDYSKYITAYRKLHSL